jgi:hypothetical protein
MDSSAKAQANTGKPIQGGSRKRKQVRKTNKKKTNKKNKKLFN